ncbi:conserved Plasmodium protein, unknown function [Plasmodium relictum]|uniref:Uncharacterized protein n=1 Tax=Plasmodium relictum TaxID=85471 RepID=A0A1J1H8M0_PLARL|nr:conserved Plasmodium protein, unknown function [Plasmodium relictum]CRG99941.1 conserved Plasmodium protein, unknown function [Plasmodium relictum]
MIIIQFFILLFVLIDIKYIISLKIKSYKGKIFLCNYSNKNKGRIISHFFVEVKCRKNIHLSNRFIIERLKNNYKFASKKKGSKNIKDKLQFSINNEIHKNIRKSENGKNTYENRTGDNINSCREIIEVNKRKGVEINNSKDKDVEKKSFYEKVKNNKKQNKEQIEKKITKKVNKVSINDNHNYYNKKKGTFNVIDIQNTNVKSFLIKQDEGRSLELLDNIYKFWKNKNFLSFFEILSNEDFDHTCIEKWLHKLSISLSKKYLKIKILDEYILIKDEYFIKDEKKIKEFKINYNVINKCLNILINNSDRFCSYEITSVLWAITIILIKSFKNYNNLDYENSLKFNDSILTIIENFNTFFSLIIKHLNQVKDYLSIDEALWAVWSICKLLYFNIPLNNYLTMNKKLIDKNVQTDNNNNNNNNNRNINNNFISGNSIGHIENKKDNEKMNYFRNKEDIKIVNKYTTENNKNLDYNSQVNEIYDIQNYMKYNNHQILFMMKKFKLNRETIINILDIFNCLYSKLYKNVIFLKEKYYIYIPFIIFESQTLMLNNSTLLLNKIIYLILENNVLLELFNFNYLKSVYSKNSNLYQNNIDKNNDIFRIKTLSKVYKLIKCISKTFYPLKNVNSLKTDLHNNYQNLNTNILIKFINTCNDVLVKYIDYFVFIINFKNKTKDKRSLNFEYKKSTDNENNKIDNEVKEDKEEINNKTIDMKDNKIELNDEVKLEYKNELIFIYNCLKSSLVSLIKLDLKDKYVYEWLNKNIHIFQFNNLNESSNFYELKNKLIENKKYTILNNKEKNDLTKLEINKIQDSNIKLNENESKLINVRNEGEGNIVSETNDIHLTYDRSSKYNKIKEEASENLNTLSKNDIREYLNLNKNNSDVCLDVLALSKFTKLYNNETKTKLILNVAHSIDYSLKMFKIIYENNNIIYPSYIKINDIYIIKDKNIEELYNEETKTFYKKNKNIEFRNIIMPKQLSIFINYLGRNIYLVCKEKLDDIFLTSIKYITTTKFNYFTSNDIIHFLQGLINYNEMDSHSKLYYEILNEMFISLCHIIENNFLYWKSSNICQLIYILTKFKHIHRNIFNKFDEYLNNIKFPYYIYQKANCVNFENVLQTNYDDNLAIEKKGGNLNISSESNNENEKMNENFNEKIEEINKIHKNNENPRTNISINEFKYDNLGSAMWALSSLNKNVIKKKYYLKFFYLFSVYFSLHMKLYLHYKFRNNKYVNFNKENAERKYLNDLNFLKHNINYFKIPINPMTVSIYVNTFARKIKKGFYFLFEVIYNNTDIINLFSIKELSYVIYSLSHINKNYLKESIIDVNVLNNLSEGKEKYFGEFLNSNISIWIEELDYLFYIEHSKDAHEIKNKNIDENSNIKIEEIENKIDKNINNNSHQTQNYYKNDSEMIINTNGYDEKYKNFIRKDKFLKFKHERINLSNEFLNILMDRLINSTSYILNEKKNPQEILSNNASFMRNDDKKNKIEIIDIIKLIYSFFILLNQKVQINETENINFLQLENLIFQYNLIVKKCLHSINYIYFVIDTYALISNIYFIDHFTRNIIKEFVQICIKKMEEEKILDLEKKKIILSIQNLKVTNSK